LSEFLKIKGYQVIGIRRRSTQETECPPVEIIEGDILDSGFLREVVREIEPDEFYHLAAMSHVGESFRIPSATLQTNILGTLNCLEAVRETGCKFYQASTSELFGDSPPPQDETSPMSPRSPYAISKLAAYWLVRNWRERGLYAVNGILYNHESPRRGADFVTQKVCTAAAEIKAGMRKSLKLGNLEVRRDWGHAEDYVRGMWLMMQQPGPDDYVLATGESRSVKDLLNAAFGCVGLHWGNYVVPDRALYRPTEVEHLKGNPAKAEALGWTRKWTFQTMIEEMVDAAAGRINFRHR